MSMVETRYYNAIWYVPEDETEADVAQETRILLPDMVDRIYREILVPPICRNKFIITDVEQVKSTSVVVRGVTGIRTGCENVVINFYFVKKSQVPSWMVCEYKIRNIYDLAAMLACVTYQPSNDTINGIHPTAHCSHQPPKEVHSGMPENGAYINMRMMDEGDLMANREPPETSTNFIMTLTTNLTKIFNGEKEVLKSMIKSVTINEKKKVTTVVFTDGDVQMAKCSKNDEYDKTVGISICIAAHLAGSKEKLKKFVKEITEK